MQWSNDFLGISSLFDDPSQYWKLQLDDTIIKTLEIAPNKELAEAREIILLIRRRRLYQVTIFTAFLLNLYLVRTIVGVIGNVISFVLFLLPVPMFVRIIKKNSVEELKPYPYVLTVMNCMLWAFYGLPIVHKDSFLVATINGAGLLIEAIYVIIFLCYCADKKNFRRNIVLYLVAEVIGVVAVVLIALIGLKNNPSAKLAFVGVICDFFNIAMYGAPCLAIKKVMRTKRVEYMPFWLSLVSFLNAVTWTAYSLFYKIDLYILVSNALGTYLCTILITFQLTEAHKLNTKRRRYLEFDLGSVGFL